MSNKIYLYGARDTTTGKLVSDITNPKRKYWDKKGNAEKAILTDFKSTFLKMNANNVII